MLCEFVDGSKTAVEMAAVSNATGLVPDVRGMHGAPSTVAELTRVFVPRADGGVLSRKGVVDFAIGVHPGVFVIIESRHPAHPRGLVQRDMGDGPYYLLFRPFHLCSLEVPITAAVAALYGESSGHPGPALVSECLAVAKRDIRAGETLDGIGETCYRGSIDTAAAASRERLLPLGVARGCVARRAIRRDQVIAYDDVDIVAGVGAAGPAQTPGQALRTGAAVGTRSRCACSGSTSEPRGSRPSSLTTAAPRSAAPTGRCLCSRILPAAPSRTPRRSGPSSRR